MQQAPKHITIDGHIIALKTIRHRRARHVSIRILEKEHAIKLTLPWCYPLQKALDFLNEREAWIANHLYLLKTSIPLKDGTTIPYFGKLVTITHTPEAKRGVWIEGDLLYVSGHKEHVVRRITDFLKKQMQLYAKERASSYAAQLNISYKLKRISIRETSSRWGSCGARGNISLCWRLIFTPKEVLDYVIAHEVSHLLEMNHSTAFWQTVAYIFPHYETSRKWLKHKGHTAWAYTL